jgi:hypothetical protein
MKVHEPNAKSVLQWIDVIACPGEIMEKVAAQSVVHTNWIFPTLLLCGISACIAGGQQPDSGQTHELYQWQVEQVARLISLVIETLSGLAWSALVLWSMARVIFKTPVHYLKTVEVVGLCAPIAALATLTYLLLGILTDEKQIQPGTTLVSNGSSATSARFILHSSVHLFNLWIVIVLAIGLSKLTKADWKECSLWTFTYWFASRVLFS